MKTWPEKRKMSTRPQNWKESDDGANNMHENRLLGARYLSVTTSKWVPEIKSGTFTMFALFFFSQNQTTSCYRDCFQPQNLAGSVKFPRQIETKSTSSWVGYFVRSTANKSVDAITSFLTGTSELCIFLSLEIMPRLVRSIHIPKSIDWWRGRGPVKAHYFSIQSQLQSRIYIVFHCWRS